MYVNGVPVATHQGGYLPFRAELTGHLTSGDNVLAVVVDARWLNVPPDNPPGGTASVDYLQPGGIYRDVRLRLVPPVFIADVFAQPVNVLTPARRQLRLEVTLDAARVPGGAATVTAQLLDGSAEVARATTRATITATGTSVVTLTMTGLEQVGLWSPDSPKLYTLRTTLHPVPGSAAQPHVYDVTTGFREAVFATDGFYLNGDRQPIFGLNRHQHFPFLGLAACARLQRRDAEILKNELNCTMVRCSHYPQSPHFLDACDELGLMVWEETPGWNYVGDAAFQQLVLGNVHDMVVRDRNRPSVIMWGTRLNETANYVDLYAQTRQTGRRPGRDPADHRGDGHLLDHRLGPGRVRLRRLPLQRRGGHPAAAAAGRALPDQRGGRRAGRVTDVPVDRPRGRAGQPGRDARPGARHRPGRAGYAGLLGWCAFDYASLNGGMRIWLNLKTPGVMDLFRVPKPGAGFYRSQVPPADKPVILPLFFWDYGPSSPVNGPGPDSAIATNCDRLELFVDGRHLGTARPDTDGYPNLACPLAFADLSVPGTGLPELRIDGYVGTTLAATVTMASDPARDRLGLTVDDTSIVADGSDTTRVTFRALDAYGHQRPYVTGDVTLALTGPGVLVGDNPFAFGTYGGVGGAFVRSTVGGTGRVTVTATHPVLGSARGSVTVTAATGSVPLRFLR